MTEELAEKYKRKRINELVNHYVSKWEDEQYLPKDWKDMRDFADYIVSMMFLISEQSGGKLV